MAARTKLPEPHVLHPTCRTPRAATALAPRLAAAQVRNGQTFVNGQQRVEPFIAERPLYEMPKLLVPPGDVRGREGAAASHATLS
jgi:hypothetical protein